MSESNDIPKQLSIKEAIQQDMDKAMYERAKIDPAFKQANLKQLKEIVAKYSKAKK